MQEKSAREQYDLGSTYYDGRGVPQDYDEAARWFRLAAERGEALAQYNLGVMYHNGQGVPQDHKEAMHWYRLAAEQGQALAQNNLGVMYHNGLGVPKNNKEAARWYRLAAEQGQTLGQNNLGTMYHHGLGVPQDYIQAHAWFALAAANGSAAGLKNRDIVAGKMAPLPAKGVWNWFVLICIMGIDAIRVLPDPLRDSHQQMLAFAIPLIFDFAICIWWYKRSKLHCRRSWSPFSQFFGYCLFAVGTLVPLYLALPLAEVTTANDLVPLSDLLQGMAASSSGLATIFTGLVLDAATIAIASLLVFGYPQASVKRMLACIQGLVILAELWFGLFSAYGPATRIRGVIHRMSVAAATRDREAARGETVHTGCFVCGKPGEPYEYEEEEVTSQGGVRRGVRVVSHRDIYFCEQHAPWYRNQPHSFDFVENLPHGLGTVDAETFVAAFVTLGVLLYAIGTCRALLGLRPWKTTDTSVSENPAPRQRTAEVRTAKGSRRMCPHCRAFIAVVDRACPYCGRAIDMRSPGAALSVAERVLRDMKHPWHPDEIQSGVLMQGGGLAILALLTLVLLIWY